MSLVAAIGLHEAYYLKLDCSKARASLGWRPAWNIENAISKIVDWSRAYLAGQDMQQVCLSQIGEYYQTADGLQCGANKLKVKTNQVADLANAEVSA